MKNYNTILTINPLSSPLKNHLTQAIDSIPDTKHILVESADSLLINGILNPSIIFLLLDKCDGKNICISELEKIRFRYSIVPIISIVDSESCLYKNCLDCKKLSWHFLPSNISSNDIELLLKWYSANNHHARDRKIEFSLKQRSLVDLFIGESVSAIEAKTKILTIAPQDVTVFIQGETGTGKELCAKLLHYLSKRSEGPFVSVNCGAIPDSLFENELFGHKKGAYTHASSSEDGLINSANQGTLFLDEIDSLPISSQVKLLRFLQEKKYRPLGQSDLNRSDVRIIFASNNNLRKMVELGKFRSDLFYRVSVVNLSLSPLRERKDDIPLLCQHFIEKYVKLYGKKTKGLRPDAILALINYSWPGNVRELENILQEAIVLSNDLWIESQHLNFKTLGSATLPIGTFQNAKNANIQNFEKEYLNSILNTFHGNIMKASLFAGKDRREIYRLIKKHSINVNQFRDLK